MEFVITLFATLLACAAIVASGIWFIRLKRRKLAKEIEEGWEEAGKR